MKHNPAEPTSTGPGSRENPRPAREIRALLRAAGQTVRAVLSLVAFVNPNASVTMKVYRGTRTEQGCQVVVEEGGATRPLDPRLDLRNHSPTGFEWGYGGSGPAQLALALAADVLGDGERAQDVYMRLKFTVVGGLPRDGFELTEDRLRAAIELVERGRSGRAVAREPPYGTLLKL